MSERSNIRDVAAKAGVAVKTVSRVLNGHPYVSADTKARVEEAMKALDFRPSVAARILSGAKSNQVALIYDNHSPYYMFQIQTGCWDYCRQNGIRLLAPPKRRALSAVYAFARRVDDIGDGVHQQADRLAVQADDDDHRVGALGTGRAAQPLAQGLA